VAQWGVRPVADDGEAVRSTSVPAFRIMPSVPVKFCISAAGFSRMLKKTVQSYNFFTE